MCLYLCPYHYSLDYCNFVVYFEIKEFDTSRFIYLFIHLRFCFSDDSFVWNLPYQILSWFHKIIKLFQGVSFLCSYKYDCFLNFFFWYFIISYRNTGDSYMLILYDETLLKSFVSSKSWTPYCQIQTEIEESRENH